MPQAQTIDPKEIPTDQAARRELAGELEQKAVEAFGRGELLTATLFACDLLMLYPNERAYLDRFDEIVLSTDDPLSVLPVATGAVHVATAAGRARVLMMQQRLPEALELLSAAVGVAPELPYVYWATRWLQPEVVRSLGFDLLFQTIVKTTLTIGVGVPVPPHEDDRRVLNLRAAADLVAVVREAFPEQSILWFGEALLRRRLGDPSATVAIAEAGVTRFPEDARMRTALMNAYRDAGRPDDALAQARAAMDAAPDDGAPLHDAAWAFVDAGRPADAARLFEELLARDPDYPGAKGCLHYTRWKALGNEEDRQALVLLRERQGWDEQVRGFADEASPPVPYVNVLPVPDDATGVCARQLAHEIGQIVRCCGLGGSVDLTLSTKHLESPSVGLAFDLAMASFGASGSLTMEVEEVQSPDPRQDKAQSSTQIWRYEDTTPVKVYAAGDAAAREAISGIARQLFAREVWDPAAKQVADRFGAEGYHALVSVLTHPPPPEDGFDAFTWTWRCQVATAVTLSHLGEWGTGYGRAAVYSMAYGPSDWVTGAAIVAFGWRVMESPALRPEVEPIFAWLRTQVPERGFTSWEIVLAEVWLALSGHSDEVRQDLEAWVADYFRTLPEKNVVRPPERRYGGLSLEDYARFGAERDRILAPRGTSLLEVAETFLLDPPQELLELCERWGVPLRHDATGVHPYIAEWQEALNASPDLHARFVELQRSFALAHLGVSGEEKAALDNILDGNMDMHLRMAQQQQAQREVQEGGGGDPDPVVFPGHPVQRLSDYVRILKGMQSGDMAGALAPYGLDMMSYGGVAQAWGAKLAADPTLTEKFSQMMSQPAY